MLRRILRKIFLLTQKKGEFPIQNHKKEALKLAHSEYRLYLQVIWFIFISVIVLLVTLSSGQNSNVLKIIYLYLAYSLLLGGILVTINLSKKLLNIRMEMNKYD